MDKQKVSQETYVQLARLAHESFEQRRSYEWKVHFGLWMAISAVVYVAISEKIGIIESPLWLKHIGFALWVMYLLHLGMVTRGHWQDKKRKHDYMRKAEGQENSEPDKYTLCAFGLQALWGIPYLAFTGSLIWFAIRLLQKVPITK
jgi:hypothetical protein